MNDPATNGGTVNENEEQTQREADDEETVCEGHPAGPFDPMGETVYCDGSCAA